MNQTVRHVFLFCFFFFFVCAVTECHPFNCWDIFAVWLFELRFLINKWFYINNVNKVLLKSPLWGVISIWYGQRFVPVKVGLLFFKLLIVLFSAVLFSAESFYYLYTFFTMFVTTCPDAIMIEYILYFLSTLITCRPWRPRHQVFQPIYQSFYLFVFQLKSFKVVYCTPSYIYKNGIFYIRCMKKIDR